MMNFIWIQNFKNNEQKRKGHEQLMELQMKIGISKRKYDDFFRKFSHEHRIV